MDAINVMVAALAAWQVTEVLHHSEIALPIRRWAARNTQVGVLRSFISRAYNCAFCLSHWVSGGAVVAMLLATELSPWCYYIRYVLAVLAVTRLANLGNDLAYTYTRTPKIDLEENPHDIEVEDDPDSENPDLRGESG